MGLEEALALESLGSGRYRRLIDAQWCNLHGGAFGGYSAALAMAACAAESPHKALCSMHVLFLESVKPQHLDLQVESERRGRSFSALRVSGTQNGRRVLAATALFKPDAPRAAVDHAEPSHISAAPADAGALPWLDIYPFYRWLETRAIDYPADMDSFVTAQPRPIAVWSRPRHGELSSGFMTQLYDILLADAHIADAMLRWPGTGPLSLLSLDLHMQWSGRFAANGWRRLVASAPCPADGIGTCSAVLYDEQRRECATASQQAWNHPGLG